MVGNQTELTMTHSTMNASDDAMNAGDAADVVVHGTCLQTNPGRPPVQGQTRVLPAGAFFDLQGGTSARISTFDNMAYWVRQVSA